MPTIFILVSLYSFLFFIYFRHNSTQTSQCSVPGNISTPHAAFASYPIFLNTAKSLASVSGPQAQQDGVCRFDFFHCVRHPLDNPRIQHDAGPGGDRRRIPALWRVVCGPGHRTVGVSLQKCSGQARVAL